MPIPQEREGRCGAPPRAVSLPVLAVSAPGEHGHGPIRRSKNGVKRAAVLLAVNLLIIGHIVLWVVTGMRETLSPVEPSESMYTLEQGTINAGFIFFALAILSTLIFGRWFCGWRCHVVALQDLCGWVMKKCGVKPKPFRTRLLVVGPLLLALYMFVWPTFKREVVKPVAGERWASIAPYLGDVPPRPELRLELTKAKFWETFPAWYVAVPFLLLCGFGTVYFLGNKGFCTYGCPYGGFFGPVDAVAPGRILVTDACEGCGHCTAVCSSNVRVHEEVRDYGMVVDTGCMKCLDCVSVCPNHALYFGFARPPVLKKAKRRKNYDLTWGEEVVFLALGLGLFMGFRGMLGMVPLLMAGGLAAIGVVLAWTAWRMVREPSVRLQSLQLKIKGAMRPWGVAVGGLAVLALAAGAWGGFVRWNEWRGEILGAGVHLAREDTFRPTYAPMPAVKARAESAIAALERAAPPPRGWGWHDTIASNADLVYLCMVAGRPAEAEAYAERVVELQQKHDGHPRSADVGRLADLMLLRRATPDAVVERVRAIIAGADAPGDARTALAYRLRPFGRGAEAVEEAAKAVTDPRITLQNLLLSAVLLVEHDRHDLALPAYRRATEIAPGSGAGWYGVAACEGAAGRMDVALANLDKAIERDPGNALYVKSKILALREAGRGAETGPLEARLREISGGR